MASMKHPECRNNCIACRCTVRKEVWWLMSVRILLAAQDSFKNLGDQLIKTYALKNIQFTSLSLDTKHKG